MRPSVRKLNDLAHNPWLVVGGSAASIIGLLLFVWEKLMGWPHFLSFSGIAVGLLAYVAGLSYSLFIRHENDALRDMAYHLHRINHDYRDVLHRTFSGNAPMTSRRDLIAKEMEALKCVCKRIEKVFTSLLRGRECTVTVKLITTQPQTGRRIAKTYVRSEDDCTRDVGPPYEYDLGTNQNSGFDAALRIPEPNRCSHFHCPDLTKITGYNNQRPQWSNYYRSSIVVPIRYLDGNRVGQPDSSQDVGFLCVDTMSRGWLNSGYHVQLLASFADQMYNFLSLMRGRYTVQVERSNE